MNASADFHCSLKSTSLLPRRSMLSCRYLARLTAIGAEWAVVSGLSANVVFAQATPPAPVPVQSNPMYLEWGITGIMIALAIFVVCRKSNRT